MPIAEQRPASPPSLLQSERVSVTARNRSASTRPPSQTAEVTLLFGTRPVFSETELVRVLATCLRRRASDSVKLDIDHRPGTYIHLSLGPLDILVSLCPLRLPSAHFAGALRPHSRLRADGHIQSMLEFHETCMTIVVASKNRRGAPVPRSRVEALCETIAHHVSRLAAPDLIYLGAADTLYAQEEFARLDPAIRPSAAATEARLIRTSTIRDAHIRAKPQVPRVAEGWFVHGHDSRRERPSEEAEAETEPTEQAHLAQSVRDTVPGHMAIYLLNVAVILFSFPIGYALLIYNIMSGGSLLVTARALSLTGITAAAATTGLPAQALALL